MRHRSDCRGCKRNNCCICICSLSDRYLVICVSDGVMYWGDAGLYTIESAYINGNGRSIYGTIYGAYYIAFLFRDDNIYFTDWTSPYVHLLSPPVTTCDSSNSITEILQVVKYARLKFRYKCRTWQNKLPNLQRELQVSLRNTIPATVHLICLTSSLLPQISLPQSISDLPGLTDMNHWLTSRLKYGERCFSHAEPKAWNSLLHAVQEITDS